MYVSSFFCLCPVCRHRQLWTHGHFKKPGTLHALSCRPTPHGSTLALPPHPCCHPPFTSLHSYTNLLAEISRQYTILFSGWQKGCPILVLTKGTWGITLLGSHNLTSMCGCLSTCLLLYGHPCPLFSHLLCMGGCAPLCAGIMAPVGTHFFILVVIYWLKSILEKRLHIVQPLTKARKASESDPGWPRMCGTEHQPES